MIAGGAAAAVIASNSPDGDPMAAIIAALLVGIVCIGIVVRRYLLFKTVEIGDVFVYSWDKDNEFESITQLTVLKKGKKSILFSLSHGGEREVFFENFTYLVKK